MVKGLSHGNVFKVLESERCMRVTDDRPWGTPTEAPGGPTLCLEYSLCSSEWEGSRFRSSTASSEKSSLTSEPLAHDPPGPAMLFGHLPIRLDRNCVPTAQFFPEGRAPRREGFLYHRSVLSCPVYTRCSVNVCHIKSVSTVTISLWNLGTRQHAPGGGQSSRGPPSTGTDPDHQNTQTPLRSMLLRPKDELSSKRQSPPHLKQAARRQGRHHA